MNVVFKNKKISDLEDGEASEWNHLPIEVIRSFQRKIRIIRDAPDERTLRNWKSLHFEKLKGKRKAEYSVRLNNQWRLTFTIDNTTKPSTVTVLAIEDYH